MARLALNKSSLSRQQSQLKTFERFLPSLDLKRRQLLAERNKARIALQRTREAIAQFTVDVGERLPMLSNNEIALRGLVRLTGVNLTEENIVGTRLPVLAGIAVEDICPRGNEHGGCDFGCRPERVKRHLDSAFARSQFPSRDAENYFGRVGVDHFNPPLTRLVGFSLPNSHPFEAV